MSASPELPETLMLPVTKNPGSIGSPRSSRASGCCFTAAKDSVYGTEDLIAPKTTAGGVQEFDLSSFGYTAILYDGEAASLMIEAPVTSTGVTPTLPAGTLSSTAVTRVGLQFKIVPKKISTVRETKLTIFGNESGATVTIPVTIKPEPVL